MSWRDGAGKCQPSEQTLALIDAEKAKAREAIIEECAQLVETRMIWWKNSSDERIRDGSENAYIARQMRALALTRPEGKTS